MPRTFSLSIVAPDKVLAQEEAVSLVVPCELGYLGVLARHAPLVANLTRGDITVRGADGRVEKFPSRGKGFIEVLHDEVVIILRSN
jgi:F-type H+-transporting ATPase subunit epsilon